MAPAVEQFLRRVWGAGLAALCLRSPWWVRAPGAAVITVAAVDVGSNAIRLAVRKVTSTGVAVGTGYKRYSLRLGGDVFSSGAVSAAHAHSLEAIFADIALRMEKAGVQRYRAVATSAMRDAANGPAIVARIAKRTRIALEIIDGEQELRLARNSLLRALGAVPPKTLLVDLGGGSLELDRADSRMGMSLPLGTVRLLEMYPALGKPADAPVVERLRGMIRQALRQQLTAPWRAPLAVGTGGNLDALARLLPVRGCPVPAIEVRRLPDFTRRIAALPVVERGRQLGLRRDRADLIVVAALVLQATVDIFGLNAFVVPGTGLRESLLSDLVGAPAVDVALRQLLTRFGQDPLASDRMARLAEQLFDLLVPVHGLWAPARGPLQAAVFLRQLGVLVDPEDPGPHSAYFAEHVRELPLDRAARRVAAYTVAVHQGAPAAAFARGLAKRDVRVAKLLVGLLHLASALERQRPRRLSVDLLSNPLVIVGAAGAPPAVQQACRPLEQALRRKIRLL